MASFFRNSEVECGPLSGLRFYPDFAAMALYNSLAKGQAYAGPGVFLFAMQALKDDEEALKILWVYANAVVAHREYPFLTFCFG